MCTDTTRKYCPISILGELGDKLGVARPTIKTAWLIVCIPFLVIGRATVIILQFSLRWQGEQNHGLSRLSNTRL